MVADMAGQLTPAQIARQDRRNADGTYAAGSLAEASASAQVDAQLAAAGEWMENEHESMTLAERAQHTSTHEWFDVNSVSNIDDDELVGCRTRITTYDDLGPNEVVGTWVSSDVNQDYGITLETSNGPVRVSADDADVEVEIAAADGTRLRAEHDQTLARIRQKRALTDQYMPARGETITTDAIDRTSHWDQFDPYAGAGGEVHANPDRVSGTLTRAGYQAGDFGDTWAETSEETIVVERPAKGYTPQPGEVFSVGGQQVWNVAVKSHVLPDGRRSVLAVPAHGGNGGFVSEGNGPAWYTDKNFDRDYSDGSPMSVRVLKISD